MIFFLKKICYNNLGDDMKKLRGLFLIALCIFLLSGCQEKEEELSTNLSEQIELDLEGAKAVCTVDYDYSDTGGYVTGSKFVIYADEDGIVTRIVGQEIASSNDKTLLTTFQESLEENYSIASQYGGYTYSTEIKGNKLYANTDIDYTQLDMDSMATDSADGELSVYLNEDNQFTLSTVQSMYMAVGADCKEL